MSTAPDTVPDEVRGRLDDGARLVEAEPRLAALHEQAGGREGGVLAIPQIASLARLSRRLGIVISRAAVAADGDRDLDLWVRAEPDSDGVRLSVSGWTERPAQPPAEAGAAERDVDFLRAAADWMWETDEELRLTSLSGAAFVAIGRAASDLRGERLTEVFHFREDETGDLPILMALAQRSRFEAQVADLRSGNRGRYLLSGVPLLDGTGRFAGFRGSAAAARAPVRADVMDAGQVPAGGEGSAFGERLDQALRGPLNHIIASAETIRARSEGPLSEEYHGYAGDIATAGRHLLAMIEDLVDLQAIERRDFRPERDAIDLADIARRAASLLSVRASERNVRIDRPPEDERLLACGEYKRALQVMMNILANAVRYSPEGGQVWIRTEQEGDLAAVIIADQGKGIAPEDQERIFQKFERVDPGEPGGTGLGLYIARRLARAMGGDVAVDSAPGQGARFTITLPLAPLSG